MNHSNLCHPQVVQFKEVKPCSCCTGQHASIKLGEAFALLAYLSHTFTSFVKHSDYCELVPIQVQPGLTPLCIPSILISHSRL